MWSRKVPQEYSQDLCFEKGGAQEDSILMVCLDLSTGNMFEIFQIAVSDELKTFFIL